MRPIPFVFMLIILRTVSIAQVNSFNIDSSKFNKSLKLVLDTIYRDDQTDRLKLPKFAKSKESTDSLWKIIREKDAINLIKIEGILNKNGWLGPQDVGMNASQAIFMVIQHADLATQEKYLPTVKKAVEDRKTLSSNLATLEDRILMREGKNQIYGSQGFTDKLTGKRYVYPIGDADRLDAKRKAVGLIPMSEYIKNWDLGEYKKMLPKIDSIVNRQNADH